MTMFGQICFVKNTVCKNYNWEIYFFVRLHMWSAQYQSKYTTSIIHKGIFSLKSIESQWIVDPYHFGFFCHSKHPELIAKLSILVSIQKSGWKDVMTYMDRCFLWQCHIWKDVSFDNAIYGKMLLLTMPFMETCFLWRCDNHDNGWTYVCWFILLLAVFSFVIISQTQTGPLTSWRACVIRYASEWTFSVFVIEKISDEYRRPGWRNLQFLLANLQNTQLYFFAIFIYLARCVSVKREGRPILVPLLPSQFVCEYFPTQSSLC